MIVAPARRAYPEECCGLMIGRRGPGESHVERIIESPNIAESDRRTSYQIDWGVLLDATKATRASSEDIVGFYHSHPEGPSSPSRTDARDAWIDHPYLIIAGPSDTPPKATCWHWTGDPQECREISVVVD